MPELLADGLLVLAGMAGGLLIAGLRDMSADQPSVAQRDQMRARQLRERKRRQRAQAAGGR